MLLHGFDFSRSERNVVGYGNPKKKEKKYIFVQIRDCEDFFCLDLVLKYDFGD